MRYSRDPKLNPQVAKWMQEYEAKLSPDGVSEVFSTLMPEQGMFEELTNFTAVPNLDLQDVARAFDGHIKYAAYARAITDVRKFIYHPMIRAAISQKFGEAYLPMVPRWLNSFIVPYQTGEPMVRVVDQFVNFMVRNVTVGTLAFSHGTLIAQAFGATNAIAVLSDGNWAAGVGRLMGGYGKFLQVLGDTGIVDGKLAFRGLHAIFERSEFMRERFGTVEQNMTEAMMEMDNFMPGHLGLKEGKAWVERFGFQAIGWAEFMTVSGPQWLAAENKALSEGKSPEQAALLANRSVVKAQGSGRKVDLAAIQRAQGIYKAFYAFSSYFNQQYQLQVDMVRNLRLAEMEGGGAPPRLPPVTGKTLDAEQGPDGTWEVPMNRYNRSKAALLVFGVLLASGVLSKWARGDDWEPEDLLFDGLRPVFGFTLGVRGMEKAAEALRAGGSGPPVQEFGFGGDLITRMWDILEADVKLALVWNAKKKDGEPRARGRVAQTLLNNGLLFGIPGAAQAGRSVEYLAQRNAGKQTPDDWTDVYMGLMYGPQKDQKTTNTIEESQR